MANEDIDPPMALVEQYGEYQALIVGRPLAERFAQYERAAAQAKRLYTRLGLFSLGAAFIATTSLICALTIQPGLREQASLALVFGLLGGAGVAAQIALLSKPIKERWIGSRFLAERVRGAKFHGFAAAICAGSQDAARLHSEKALAMLTLDEAKPVAAMLEFDPETAPAIACAGTWTAQQLSDIKAIYRSLRLDFQIKHAKHCIDAIEQERRLPAAVSETSFWLGAALGYVDLILTALGNDSYAAWRQFFTLFFFVTSALLFVLERGRSHTSALDRYEEYKHALARVSGALDRADTAEEIAVCIRDGERVAMRELKAFCREATRSTYLF